MKLRLQRAASPISIYDSEVNGKFFSHMSGDEMFPRASKNFIARVVVFVEGEDESSDQELSMKIRFPNMNFSEAERELLSVLGEDIRTQRAQIISLKREIPAHV